MERKIKKILSGFMCAAMLLCIIPSGAFAAERAVVDSGFCGADEENLSWTLYDDGELVISGEGKMDWYYVDSPTNPKLPPWYGYYDKIDAVIVTEGVTSIGHHAFYTGLKENGNEPAKYYKIALPRSLVFVEGRIFEVLSRNRVPGQHLAFCYAGSEGDWNKVEFKNCSIVKYDSSKPYEIEYTGGSFGNRIVGSDFEKLYFGGKEPDNFCELVRYYSDDIDLVTHYYAPGAEKIVWYSVHNDKMKKVGEIPAGEYVTAEIRLPTIREGDLYLRAEILDSAGNIIAISENFLIQSIPVDNRTFFEKIEYFFAEVGFTVFFITFFMVIPALLSPITTPIGLLSALFEDIIKK